MHKRDEYSMNYYVVNKIFLCIYFTSGFIGTGPLNIIFKFEHAKETLTLPLNYVYGLDPTSQLTFQPVQNRKWSSVYPL